MEENNRSQVHVVTGNVLRILRHTLILLKFLKLILISVDEMLPGCQLVPFNHYASHKFISGKVTSLKLSKVPKP